MNYSNLHENVTHTSTVKPFNLYRQRIPELFSCTPLHWHNEFEIHFIREGCADYIINREKFTSAEGDIIIASPNALHSAHQHGNIRQTYDVFIFSPEMLGLSSGDRLSSGFILPIVSGSLYVNPRISQEHVYYSELRTTMENIISAALGDSPMLDLLIKSELSRFFWLLKEAGNIKKINNRSPVGSEIIRPAIEYMNLHFSDSISISDLAKEVSLSESYFMQKFKETAGISAIEYLNQLRIKAVCECLSSTKKPAAEIAFECGFRNLSNFNRVFKRTMGTTPRGYRSKIE